MRAFSDVRQVVAMSAVGTSFGAALATPGVARLRQNRPVAKSFRLLAHAGIGSPRVTPNFDFIVVSSDTVTSSPTARNLRWRHRVQPNATAMVRLEAALINSCEGCRP